MFPPTGTAINTSGCASSYLQKQLADYCLRYRITGIVCMEKMHVAYVVLYVT